MVESRARIGSARRADKPGDRPDDDSLLRRLAGTLPDGDSGLWPAWATDGLAEGPFVRASLTA